MIIEQTPDIEADNLDPDKLPLIHIGCSTFEFTNTRTVWGPTLVGWKYDLIDTQDNQVYENCMLYFAKITYISCEPIAQQRVGERWILAIETGTAECKRTVKFGLFNGAWRLVW